METLTKPECLLCETHEVSPYQEENGHDYVKCQSCGFVYLHPRPSEEELHDIYQEEEGATFHHGAEIAASYEKRLEARLRWRVVQSGLDVPLRKALEVGCGAGYFLELLEASGWQGKGCELAQSYVDFARDRLKLDVTKDIKECTGPYGAIFLFNVLSHYSDPERDIRDLRDRLVDGGVLVMETGNVAEVSPDKVGHLGAPDHVYHFSEANIRALLLRCGFREVTVYRRNVEWQRRFLGFNPKKGPEGHHHHHGHSHGHSHGEVDPSKKPLWKRVARSFFSHFLLALRFRFGKIFADQDHYCTLFVIARR